MTRPATGHDVTPTWRVPRHPYRECAYCSELTCWRDKDGDPACKLGEGCAVGARVAPPAGVVAPTVQVRGGKPAGLYEHGGEWLTLKQWAERTAQDPHRLYQRVKVRGWSMARALSEPVREAGIHNKAKRRKRAAAVTT